MSVHSTRLPRLLRATASASVLAIAACSAERATGPSRDGPADPRNPSHEVFVPITPIIPCEDEIFRDDFSYNSVNTFPTGNAPAIGSWTGSQSAGIIRVHQAVGLMSKPVVLTQYAGLTGGVNLSGRIRCASVPSTGVALVQWRSAVHSATVTGGAIVLRDDQSRILAAVEYRPNGVVSYNGIPVPGVTWAKDVSQTFRISLNLSGHTSSLDVNGILRRVNVPYYQASAAGLWRISMELGGTSAQSFAWDDIVAAHGTDWWPW